MASDDPNLKIRIDTEADISGAKATEKAIEQVGSAAEKANSQVSNLKKSTAKDWGSEAIAGVEARQAARERARQAATPPPLPGGNAAAGIGASEAGLAAAGVAAGVTASAITAAGVAAVAFTSYMADGAVKAGELAKALRDLPADKAAELRQQMGPLAKIIEANSAQLIEYSENVEKAAGKVDQAWIAAGAQIVPALADIAEAAANVDLTKVGSDIGAATAGAIYYLKDMAYWLGEVSTQAVGGAENMNRVAESIKFAFAGPIMTFDLLLKRSREANQSEEQLAKTEQKRAEASLKAAEALRAAKEKAQDKKAPISDQIAKLEIEQQKAILAGSVAQTQAIFNQIEALKQKASIQAEAALREQEAAAAAEKEYQLRVYLNEAIASGNKEEEERIRRTMDYNAAIKQTGDEQLAIRAADAAAAIRRQKTADEAKKQDEDRRAKALQDELALKKAQADTRLKSLQVEGASETQIATERKKALEDQLRIEQEIADIKGEGAQQAAIAEEQRKQAALDIEAAEKRTAATKAKEQQDIANRLATGPGDHEGKIDARTGINKKYNLRDTKYDAAGNLIGASQNGRPLTNEELGALRGANNMDGSPLDRHLRDQPGQPGYQPIVPGAAAPGTPTSPPAAQAPATASGGGDASGAADKMGSTVSADLQKVAKSIDAATDAISESSGAVLSAMETLGSRIKRAETDITAMKRRITS